MINVDEDALICDLAETYHIYDYRKLPLKKVATFSCGLKDDSRIKIALSDTKCSADTLLMAMMVDDLNFIAWSKTENAKNNENRPSSIVNLFLNREEQKEVSSFASGEEYEEFRSNILRDIEWQQN